MPRQSTFALPLALAYVALIVYASLYPFGPWRNQGIAPWAFLAAPWPRYWSGFDVVANALGYGPLGFLLALAAIRGWGSRHPVLLGFAAAAGLSLAMESLQSYLPMRVPSSVDWLLNMAGAWLGAMLAWALDAQGWIARWARLRQRWLNHQANSILLLLALWPVALLSPTAMPLGLGQVLVRLQPEWAASFAAWSGPLAADQMEFWCVLLGALAPCLLVCCVLRPARWRWVFALGLLLLGLGLSALSAALRLGPAHGWEWLVPAAQKGFWAAAMLALLLSGIGPRLAAALALLVLLGQVVLLNQVPASPYFEQSVQTWEQGRFIRFHGASQWLGWLWPYAAIALLLRWLCVPIRPSNNKLPDHASERAPESAPT